MNQMGRWIALGVGLLGAAWSMGQDVVSSVLATPAPQARQRILLIPIDDRPAVTQFAQMIGSMADVEVVTPPSDMLGKFTSPGEPARILRWMREQNLSKFDTVIVNLDMIAYGGLIASRVPDTSYPTAVQRLRSLWKLRRENPQVPFYGFGSIMRLAPTATRQTASWRGHLARYAELKAKYRIDASPETLRSLRNLESKIPAGEIQRYESARDRNSRINQEVMRMTARGVFDFLVLGQDDAQPMGPHLAETARLREMATNLKLGGKALFCQGIDQLGNVLMSRALLDEVQWTPRVRVVYADDLGRTKIAAYESRPVELSLNEQLIASGAQLAQEGESFDYTLFVNTPEPRTLSFLTFLDSVRSEVGQGFPVAVADINLGKTGTGDPELFSALTESGLATRLLAYAGWNTAGNSLGTVIPAANVFLLSRRLQVDPVEREINQRAFLLHRLVNDFLYHRFTRPQAYAMIDANPRASREETYGNEFEVIDDFVHQDLSRRLDETFRAQFMGRRFFAGTRQFVFRDLRNVEISLPWPRAYEVRIQFSLEAEEVVSGSR